MINKHGDHKSPKDRVVGPFPTGLFMASKWGLYTNHLLTGMILQARGVHWKNQQWAVQLKRGEEPQTRSNT